MDGPVAPSGRPTFRHRLRGPAALALLGLLVGDGRGAFAFVPPRRPNAARSAGTRGEPPQPSCPSPSSTHEPLPPAPQEQQHCSPVLYAAAKSSSPVISWAVPPGRRPNAAAASGNSEGKRGEGNNNNNGRSGKPGGSSGGRRHFQHTRSGGRGGGGSGPTRGNAVGRNQRATGPTGQEHGGNGGGHRRPCSPPSDGPAAHSSSKPTPSSPTASDDFALLQQQRKETQMRVVKIISGKEYGAEDVLAVVGDPEVGEFLRLHRCEGYVKALFRLSALLVNSTSSVQGGGSPRWLHTDPRFLHLVDCIDAQAQTPAGFSAQSYSKMLTAFAHLDYLPPIPLMGRLRDGMQARLEAQTDFLDPYSMSHVISAFVNLRYNPGEAFLALFAEAAANQLMDFHPVGLMSLIRGFAKLNYDPGQSFLKLFTACCRRKLPEFPPRALSSTIQGLASLKYRPPPEFMAALVECMDRELDNFTWLDLPNAITALSKLMYTPPDPFLRRLVSRARAKLTSFNSQALCNFIFGLCKLAHDPGVDFMADYFAACRARMPAFTPAGFASMIHSVARLGYFPGHPFMGAFEAEVMSRGLDTFTRGELWKLAHGVATLRHRPSDEFLAAYFRAFNAKAGSSVGGGGGSGGNGGMGKLTVKDVSLVLWSMAALDAGPQHAPALATLVDAAAALVARHQLHPQDDEHTVKPGGDDPAVLKYRQLVQAGLYFRSLGDPALNAALDRLDASLHEAWCPHAGAPEKEDAEEHHHHHHHHHHHQQEKPSGAGVAPSVTASPTPTFHAAVLELLEEAGVNVEAGTLHNVFNLELLLYPLSGKTATEAPVVLLLEGRGHFFTNALSRYTGDAEFRRRLVVHAAEAEGCFKAVGQVTIWEWRAGKGKAARLRLLRSRLGSLGVEPDAYIPAPPPHADADADADAEESQEGNGPVHHVAAELVVEPEAQAAATPMIHTEPVAAAEPGPVAGKGLRKEQQGGDRRQNGYNHQRGGKRRIVAAALRASKVAAAEEAGGAGDTTAG